ncbi:Lcl C-terminal domain-containing protein [Hydrogenophaga sp. OTU3427]|uniref:Lcl C-terminal domain-containing protein n=1 Tax=Hydrogenophaga sp. OTU3427 TaxID=3043856 RepID=UPI00313EDF06
MKTWRRVLCAVTACLALASMAAAPAEPRFAVSEDGDYIIDLKARLAWPRCVEGMVWNGKTCTGQPQLFDHTQAAAHALARWKAEGARWRLPHTTELQRLVDKSLPGQGLDPALFPQAPRQWHWSGTANINTGGKVNPYSYDNVQQGRTAENANRMGFLHGWAVNLVTGEARNDVTKRTPLPLRLVRPAF